MTTKMLFVYDPDDSGRDNVLAQVLHYAENYGRKCHIEVKPPLKSREQEQHYHAMIGDIARQVPFYGRLRDADSFVKRILINAFKYDTRHDPDLAQEWVAFGEMELVPALNNSGFVAVGEQSRKFSNKLAAGFIEWLGAFGAEHSVRWSVSKRESARYE